MCHYPGGPSRGQFDLRFDTPLEKQGLLNGALVAEPLGLTDPRIIVPGNPARSILLERLRCTDGFRMPPLAVHDIPQPILPALEEWIKALRE
jgi:hypothetical protein